MKNVFKNNVLTLCLILLVLSPHKPQSKTNKYVLSNFKLEKIKQDKFALIITLKPIPGIHINSEPRPEIKFNEPVEVLNIKFDKAKGSYIDTQKPIIVELKIKTHEIKSLSGKFIYFYCSDDEGWCSKFVENFRVEL